MFARQSFSVPSVSTEYDTADENQSRDLYLIDGDDCRMIVLQNAPMVARAVTQALLLLVLGTSTLRVELAQASLAGDAASVSSDADALHGVVQASILQQFQMQEIVTDNGIQVREYLNQKGTVFAVTWAGPVVPDLQQLLGTQFAAYTTALAARDHLGLHRSVRVATSGLVVESDGHLRAYVGRAYLPALIPTGVSAAELR
jgi:hypothetical protein